MDESEIVASAELRARYAEPHRRYHNLVHVEAVSRPLISWLLRNRSLMTIGLVVRLAAWFHDAVYDPRATDNEERSAQLAHATLAESGVDGSLAGGGGTAGSRDEATCCWV